MPAAVDRGAARRQEVLDATRRLLLSEGLAGTTLRRVGSEVNLSAGNVLHHFGTRSQLVLQVLSMEEDRSHAALVRRLEAVPDARERLELLFAAAVPRGAAKDIWILWLEIWARAATDPGLARAKTTLSRRWVDLIASIIRDGQVQRQFRPIDAEQAASALASLIDGLVIALITSPPGTVRRTDKLELLRTTAHALLGHGGELAGPRKAIRRASAP